MQFLAKGICPICKQKGNTVDKNVLLHHINDISKIKNDAYFTCKSSKCEIIYFSLSHSFTCKELNKEVGIKKFSSPEANMCYCFNIKKKDIDENSISKIKQKMKDITCQCEIRNPFGSCCMSGIKIYLKEKS